MCCLNVWPSASLQLYIVAHCDKQLHAPALNQSPNLTPKPNPKPTS